MIINNIKTVKIQMYTGILREALELLQATDFDRLAVGTYPVHGDDLLFHVQEYETLSRGDVEAEIHKKYCDVQYIVSGKEVIGWAPMDSSLTFDSYKEENDIAFFAPVKEEIELRMFPDMFAFFLPREIHRPRLDIAEHEKNLVKKIVIKIKAAKL